MYKNVYDRNAPGKGKAFLLEVMLQEECVDPNLLQACPLDGETCFFFFSFISLKTIFKKMVFVVAAYFRFFLKENKIINTNSNTTPCLEHTCLRNRVQIQRSCYILGRYDSEP